MLKFLSKVPLKTSRNFAFRQHFSVIAKNKPEIQVNILTPLIKKSKFFQVFHS